MPVYKKRTTIKKWGPILPIFTVLRAIICLGKRSVENEGASIKTAEANAQEIKWRKAKMR